MHLCNVIILCHSSLDVEPSEYDFSDHMMLISEAVKRDKDLSTHQVWNSPPPFVALWFHSSSAICRSHYMGCAHTQTHKHLCVSVPVCGCKLISRNVDGSFYFGAHRRTCPPSSGMEQQESVPHSI